MKIIKNGAAKDAILYTVSDRRSRGHRAAGSNLKVISSFSSEYGHIGVKEATARGV